jgi:hypothetical protein
MKRLDLSGQKFGLLTAVAYTSNRHWRCQCDCGNECVVQGKHLRTGHTTSCGCYKIAAAVSRIRHGHARAGHHSPTHRSWRAAQTRCDNPKSRDYPSYGARGIAVCGRWRSFDNFLADMGPRPNGMTLDRWPNVNGNYEPGNCRWATRNQQAKNKRKKR